LPLVPGRKSDAHSSRLPKIVWSYWNGDVSPFVLACIGNIRRFVSSTAGGQWIVVTDAEIDPFLSTYGRHVLHSFPELSAQHRADLIRLLLLHEHGGIWTDATNIFTENLDWVDEVWGASDPDLFSFRSPQEDQVFLWNGEQIPLLENWFLAVVPKTPFISQWNDIPLNLQFRTSRRHGCFVWICSFGFTAHFGPMP
jgi:hypothetical protein